jgi:hypothetical protein
MIRFLGERNLLRPGAFLTVILLGIYARISTSSTLFWQYRDDSVIHLSHAKNLAMYGSVGLSPGDRTEAMSSPLNYLISQFWYLLSPNLSYETYLDGYNILILVSFALSYTFCVTQVLSKIEKVDQIHYWAVSLFPFAMVLASWTTFGWMISGMENALGASLILLLIGLTINVQEKRIYLVGFLIALLGIARIEFAVLLLPFFCGILFRFRGTRTSPVRLLLDLSPIFLAWALFHCARYLYFGQLTPNTAQALGKNANLTMAMYLLTQFYFLSRLLGLTKSLKSKFGYAAGAFQFGSFLLIVNSNLNRSDFNLFPSLVVSTLILIITVVTVSRLKLCFTKRLTLLLLIAQLNEYFLFGPARLSEFRIVAIFIPALLILFLKLLLDSLEGANFGKKNLALVMATFLIPFAFLVLSKVDPVRNLCCRISPSENLISNEANNFLRANNLSQTARPISASPDLGKISFAKKVIVVDLGLIGDPILGSLTLKHPEKVERFLNDFVAPDIVESHGFWSCRYSEFLESAEFKRQYRITYTGSVSNEFNGPPQANCPFSGEYTIWTRLLPVAESAFALKLNSSSVANFPTLIQKEVTKCSEEKLGLERCQYVFRGVLRELERVNRSQLSSIIVESLALSPTFQLDKLRLEKRSHWAKAVQKELLRLSI